MVVNKHNCPVMLDDPQLLGLKDLIGTKIVDIGMLDCSHIDDFVEGGLAIDYCKDGDTKRIILGFTDLGMWTDWQGSKGKKNLQDLLFDRLLVFIKAFDDGETGRWEIKGKPLDRKFIFSKDGKEIIRFDISELKMMELSKSFSSTDLNVSEIVTAIHLWFYSNAPGSVMKTVED